MTKHSDSLPQGPRDRPTSEKLFSEKLHRFACGLGHIEKRWQDRLSAKNISLWESYLDGDVSIILDFEWRIGGEVDGIPGKRAVGKLHPANPDGGFVNLNHGNNQVVFVDIVKVGDGPDRLVSSGIPVGLYLIEDKPLDVGEGGLYRRLREGVYEVLPSFVEGERGFSRVGRGSVQSKPEVIECGPKVVDRVSDHQWHQSSGLTKRGELSGFATIRLFSDGKSVGWDSAQLANGSIELVDVAVGPFDL
ncbi:hypothetical protein GRI55_03175 [Erythrobacter citreus]|uniref:Uncharacterized protein n=1 Tax=Qipengyuania citrea TaxID=225971 RepID=A0A6I4UC73_9SPHN|nr:hypothetical protein [Qipengyuania citrea]MDQ0566412.1 hypothetical protein [Qipengyuania citrea]MXP34769.1 hypothetical protein [Qipengyuania citrea]